jgi:hypothetical protein
MLPVGPGGLQSGFGFSFRIQWKGAIAQPGLSEYSFGAAGEEIFLRPSDHKPLVERRAQHAARE